MNSRLLHLITLIDGTTGEPIWQFGGHFNQFADESNGQATNFAWEHDVRFSYDNGSEITLLDNHQLATNANCTANCSRGMVIELEYSPQTARLKHEFYHPNHVQSGAEGSVQPLPNGNYFVGWGQNPTFTEHQPNGQYGTTILSVQFQPWYWYVNLYIIGLNATIRSTDSSRCI